MIYFLRFHAKEEYALTSEKKGMLAAGTAFTIFGFSYLFSKIALNIVEPMILLTLRFGLTVLVMQLLVSFRIVKLQLKGKKLLWPIVLGILQPVLYFVMENYGIKYTTTSFTGIIASISPIFTAVLGAVLLREKLTARQWLCITLSIAGVLMVSLGATGGQNTVGGCLCLLGAYLCGSLYTLLSRKLSKAYAPFDLTYIMFIVGFLFFLLLSLIQYGGHAPALMAEALSHGEVVLSIGYLGVLSSVIAYLLINYSLKHLPAARSNIFGNVSTVVSVLAGIFILHDPFSPIILIAFVLIFGGVWGVNAFAKKE